MTLRELMEKVKEKELSKDQLEEYRNDMSRVYAEMQIELADVEKSKAGYFERFKMAEPQTTDISIKRTWQASTGGLREIELKRYCLATKELLNSLKSRLYSIY